VTCTANDGYTGTVTAKFTSTVSDTTGPSLSVTPPPTADATSPRGANVTWRPQVSDKVTPEELIQVNCNGIIQAGGTEFSAEFPFGNTTVSCSATDNAGNAAERPVTFDVTVEDRTAPKFEKFPIDRLIEADSESTTLKVTWDDPTATDNYDTNVDITCTPASGSDFNVGKKTTVSCTATDEARLTDTKTFTVEVQDNVPPTIRVPDNADLSAANAAGADWTNTPAPSFGAYLIDGKTTKDAICDVTKPDNSPLVCAAGTRCTFPLGVTAGTAGVSTVNCSGSDVNGNIAWASFTITVSDKTPPVISYTEPKVLEAANASGAVYTLSMSATDNVDGAVPVEVKVNGSRLLDLSKSIWPLVRGWMDGAMWKASSGREAKA
jgi:hypothetical protein